MKNLFILGIRYDHSKTCLVFTTDLATKASMLDAAYSAAKDCIEKNPIVVEMRTLHSNETVFNWDSIKKICSDSSYVKNGLYPIDCRPQITGRCYFAEVNAKEDLFHRFYTNEDRAVILKLEPKHYVRTVDMPASVYYHDNALLSIDDMAKQPELVRKLGAKPDDSIPIASATYNDGTKLSFTLRSGQSNYWIAAEMITPDGSLVDPNLLSDEYRIGTVLNVKYDDRQYSIVLRLNESA